MLARFKNLTTALLFAAGLFGATAAWAADPVVFAAASTKDAITDIANDFAAAGKGKVVTSFGSSGDLAKQIENGAPASIFISADSKWADYLDKKNLLVLGSRSDLLGNHLVLIAPADSTMTIDLKPGAPLAAALGDGKLAVCDPESVPAGRYAKASLTKLGIWKEVESQGRRRQGRAGGSRSGRARRGAGRRGLQHRCRALQEGEGRRRLPRRQPSPDRLSGGPRDRP